VIGVVPGDGCVLGRNSDEALLLTNRDNHELYLCHL
jgi:hypothetical protein